MSFTNVIFAPVCVRGIAAVMQKRHMTAAVLGAKFQKCGQ